MPRASSSIRSSARFRDDESGGFFDTPIDHEKLITRPKDLFDNATPSGNSVACDVLLRLALLFGERAIRARRHRGRRSRRALAEKYPSGFGFLLGVAEWRAGQPKEIVLTGEHRRLPPRRRPDLRPAPGAGRRQRFVGPPADAAPSGGRRRWRMCASATRARSRRVIRRGCGSCWRWVSGRTVRTRGSQEPPLSLAFSPRRGRGDQTPRGARPEVPSPGGGRGIGERGGLGNI